jgi:hypothetical protein
MEQKKMKKIYFILKRQNYFKINLFLYFYLYYFNQIFFLH